MPQTYGQNKGNNMNLMTPEQTVNSSINAYPSLYAAGGLEQSKLRIYDHIFNVIGNGIRDTEEYIEYMTIYENTNVSQPPEKYMNGERLYHGYIDVEIFEAKGEKIYFPKGKSIDGVFSESEKVLHPEVKKWVGFNTVRNFDPYPNFSKEYSTFWQIDTSILSQEWIGEIIWFYKKCQDFFNGPDAHTYHYAVPKNEKKLQSTINAFENAFNRYSKDCNTEEEKNEAISNAYNLKYDGDTLDFITRKWETELNRILTFIDETITMLESIKQDIVSI